MGQPSLTSPKFLGLLNTSVAMAGFGWDTKLRRQFYRNERVAILACGQCFLKHDTTDSLVLIAASLR